MSEYDHLILMRYRKFTLFLHQDQRYLGRAYAWSSRNVNMTMMRLSRLDPWEREDLFMVMQEYERALADLWKPDHMNYAWLGNEVDTHDGHGHMHLIPRYRGPRTFNDEIYTDEQWGKNYSPYNELKPQESDLLAIRDAIREKL